MKTIWQAEMRSRLDQIYTRLAAGRDVPPGLQLRAEGFAEAGLALSLCSADELVALIEDRHQAHLGVSVSSHCGFAAHEAVADGGTVRLPVQMQRAPVVPTTRD